MLISSSLHGCRCGRGGCPLGPFHRSRSLHGALLYGSVTFQEPIFSRHPLGIRPHRAHLGDTMLRCEPRSPACPRIPSSVCVLVHPCVPSSWTAPALRHRFPRQAPSRHPPSRASSPCTMPSTHLRVDGSQAEKTEKDFPKEDDRAQREAAIAGVPKGLQSLC